MKIDPKGLSCKPSSCLARESCMTGFESAKETLRVSDEEGNRELIQMYEEKVKKVILVRK